MQKRRALISVSDKTGLVSFARRLTNMGYEIVSTGGTGRALDEAGISFLTVEEVTGYPEMMDGRLKVLHPKIMGGILCRYDVDFEEMQTHGIVPIALVVVNFYPFSASAANRDLSTAEVVEKIDVGGPSMVTAAIKNHQWVGVVTSPSQYKEVADAMELELDNDFELTLEKRVELACAASKVLMENALAEAYWLSENRMALASA